ncbi:hypothetical protein ACWEKT_39710, partial [Nocardia takedensis]
SHSPATPTEPGNAANYSPRTAPRDSSHRGQLGRIDDALGDEGAVRREYTRFADREFAENIAGHRVGGADHRREVTDEFVDVFRYFTVAMGQDARDATTRRSAFLLRGLQGTLPQLLGPPN